MQDYFLANDGAKLKLFDPGSFSFGVWLASSSSSFFKKIFCDENTALVEKYRNNDKAIVYERYKSDFEQKVRLLGETSGVDVSREALLFSDCLYKYLVNNDCKKLNTYDPSRQTFDAWFGWVLHNYTIDQYRKKTKKSNEDVYDIVYAKKNDDEMIEQGGLFRIDEQDTFYGWEKLILTLDDEEKIELMDIVRKTVETLQPPRYRDVLIDLYYKGDEYEIIAQRYQVTKANAQNIASRALKRLKEKLNEKGYRIKI